MKNIFFWIYTFLFCLAFTQTQNYAGNQHTYFTRLYGQLAIGNLEHDWFAKSYDFVILFNQLGAFTLQYLNADVFYLYNTILCILYFYSINLIIKNTFPSLFLSPKTNTKLHLFWASFIFLHAFVINYVAIPVINTKLFSLFFGGFSHASALHYGFMPSDFGILFFLAIALFLQSDNTKYVLRYAVASAFFLALGSAFHLNSLITAGFLAIAFIFIQQKYYKTPIYVTLICAVIFAIITLPCLLPHFQNFLNEDKNIVTQATEIYTKIRVPHHVDAMNLLSVKAFIQFFIILLALYCLKNHKPLFYVILIPFIISVLLLGLQVVTGNTTLAAAQITRSSTTYIPICSTILLASLILRLDTFFLWIKNKKFVNFIENNLLKISLLASVLLAISGILKMYLAVEQRKNNPKYHVYQQIKTYHQQTAPPLYLIPPQIEEFRLETLQPIVVDWKNHPLKSEEILEWYKRYLLAKNFYQNKSIDCQMIADFTKQYPISHIFVHDSTQITCEKSKLLFAIKPYKVYAITF